MTLYEIDEQLAELLNESDDDGEITEDIFERLTAVRMLRTEKIENIALFIKNLTAEADAIKAEKQKLEERQRAKNNKAERLKQYLDFALAGQKFESARVSIAYRKSQAVNITDETQIPAEFLEPQAPKVLKTEISRALKAGEEVPGAVLETRQNLQVK